MEQKGCILGLYETSESIANVKSDFFPPSGTFKTTWLVLVLADYDILKTV